MKKAKKPNGYWTKERCQEEALKYNSRKSFEKGSRSAYQICKLNKWFDEVCSHMVFLNKPTGYWTKDKCQEEALKYNGRKAFYKGSTSAYSYASKNKWLDEICSHMVFLHKPNGYWSKENCQIEALKYKTRRTFRLGSGSAYQSASRNNWIDEICSHMKQLKKPSGYWTKENCYKEALKYNTRNEFRIGNHIPYQIACRNNWIDEMCSHMIPVRKPTGYWTKDRCQIEALKYNGRKLFQKNSASAYQYSLKNKWLDEICSHMDVFSKPKNYWNKEHCQEEALKYNTRRAFEIGSASAYNASSKNKWLSEICSHMIEIRKPSGYWDIKERCQEEALKYNNRIDFKKNSGGAHNAANRKQWLNEICSHMIKK